MSRNRKRVFTIMLCMICMLLTGCWDQKIYEEIGFILQTGLELDTDKKVLYTITVPVITPEMKGKSDVLSTTGDLLRESRENIRHTLGKKVEAGKVQHLYISKELARQGILEYLDVFIRNPENPLLANIVVVEGSPKELMEASVEFKDKPMPAMYVNDLLVEARQNGSTPETRVYDYIIRVYSKTLDAAAPLVSYDSESIRIIGSALFNGDKMVGEINTYETGLLSMLMGKNVDMQYIYTKDKDNGIATLIKNIKRKVIIYTEEESLKIDIKLDMIAGITEYKGAKQFDKQEDVMKLEEEVAKAIQQECDRLLKYLQQVNSDPAGFGELLRSKHNDYWKSINWDDIYKEVTFNVDAKMKFEFYGAVN